MSKEEIPIELYKTEDNNFVKFVRYEEIERLNNIIEIKNNRIQQLMNRTRSARIDKAIENINKYEEIHGINYMFENEDFKEELLNILKGEDK